MEAYGGFLSHGGIPVAGWSVWFRTEKPTKLDEDWGYPYFRKPPYIPGERTRIKQSQSRWHLKKSHITAEILVRCWAWGFWVRNSVNCSDSQMVPIDLVPDCHCGCRCVSTGNPGGIEIWGQHLGPSAPSMPLLRQPGDTYQCCACCACCVPRAVSSMSSIFRGEEGEEVQEAKGMIIQSTDASKYFIDKDWQGLVCERNDKATCSNTIAAASTDSNNNCKNTRITATKTAATSNNSKNKNKDKGRKCKSNDCHARVFDHDQEDPWHVVGRSGRLGGR